MTDNRIVRAALLQASWTGDKESMLDKHIEYTRHDSDHRRPLMSYQ